MNTKRMKKSKVTTILFVLVIALVLSLFQVAGTYAKYSSTITGTGTATVARWDLDFKKDGTSVSNNFEFALSDLVNTNVTQGKIAPGSKGSMSFEINATGSEVAIDYSIYIDADILKSKLPIRFYTDEAMLNEFQGSRKGELAIGGTTGVINIYWQWISISDADDTIIGTDVDTDGVQFTVKMTAEQRLTSTSSLVSNIDEIKNFTANQTAILNNDIVVNDAIVLDTECNIDLNSYSIKAKSITIGKTDFAGTVKISNGSLIATEGNISLLYPEGTLTIENLTQIVPTNFKVILSGSTNTINLEKGVKTFSLSKNNILRQQALTVASGSRIVIKDSKKELGISAPILLAIESNSSNIKIENQAVSFNTVVMVEQGFTGVLETANTVVEGNQTVGKVKVVEASVGTTTDADGNQTVASIVIGANGDVQVETVVLDKDNAVIVPPITTTPPKCNKVIEDMPSGGTETEKITAAKEKSIVSLENEYNKLAKEDFSQASWEKIVAAKEADKTDINSKTSVVEVFTTLNTAFVKLSQLMITIKADEATLWYNAEATVMELSSEIQLRAFADKVNGGITFVGKTVKLTRDINLNGEWTPIGSGATLFQGIFDGQSHTIIGLLITTPGEYIGLFGKVGKATICNINVVGKIDVTLENTDNQNGSFIGGIIGYAGASDSSYDTDIVNCSSNIDFDVIDNSSDGVILWLGGIVGYGRSRAVNVTNAGTIDILFNVKANANIGGIGHSGHSIVSAKNSANINVTSTQNDTYYIYVGGIAGSPDMVAHSANEGNITVTATGSAYACGIGFIKEEDSSFALVNSGKIIGRYEDSNGNIIEVTDNYNNIGVYNISAERFSKAFAELDITKITSGDQLKFALYGAISGDVITITEGEHIIHNTVIPAGVTLNLSSGVAVEVKMSYGKAVLLENNGTIIIAFDATLTITIGTTLQNNNTGVIENYGNIKNYGTVENNGKIDNYGVIYNLTIFNINNGGIVNNCELTTIEGNDFTLGGVIENGIEEITDVKFTIKSGGALNLGEWTMFLYSTEESAPIIEENGTLSQHDNSYFGPSLA